MTKEIIIKFIQTKLHTSKIRKKLSLTVTQKLKIQRTTFKLMQMFLSIIDRKIK